MMQALIAVWLLSCVVGAPAEPNADRLPEMRPEPAGPRLVELTRLTELGVSDIALESGEGLVGVEIDGKWGFVDSAGTLVIPPRFDGVLMFSEGLCLAIQGDKAGYIEKSGDWAIPPQFDFGLPFSEGRAAVEVDGRWGVIDTTGTFVVPATFKRMSSFSEGLAAGATIGGERVLLDRNGERKHLEVWPNSPPSDGLICVQTPDGWGYINTDLQMVIAPQFDDARAFSDGVAVVKTNGQIGILSRDGTLTMTAFEELDPFSEGLSVAFRDVDIGYINKRGEVVIPGPFRGAYGFAHGLAAVRKEAGFGVIDRNGRTVVPFEYEKCRVLGNRLVAVRPARPGATWRFLRLTHEGRQEASERGAASEPRRTTSPSPLRTLAGEGVDGPQ